MWFKGINLTAKTPRRAKGRQEKREDRLKAELPNEEKAGKMPALRRPPEGGTPERRLAEERAAWKD
jgi:hypothetical protein